MNDVMSGGVHRLWKDYFMEQLAPQPGTKLLDVGGGTGKALGCKSENFTVILDKSTYCHVPPTMGLEARYGVVRT